MEPVTTAAVIASITGYLAKTLKDNKPINEFFNEFSEASIKWIKPIFLKEDGQPKEMLEDLKDDPTDNLNTQAAENAIAKAIKKEPDAESLLLEMFDVIQNKKAKGEVVHINAANIDGNRNTVIQGVNSGGDTNITIGKSDRDGK